MTKVDIISGFLGAGKTTLIKKLIAEAFKGQQLVLIENEFGEIGIDGGFLKEAGINITEMNSGCICCSLVGDFGVALKEVVDKYHPDRIIIEPTGVGKLSDIAKAVKNIDESVGLEINALVTVVDGTKAKMYMKNFGEFFNNQIENAGTIVISRSQNMDQEKLDELIAQLRVHNAESEIITTNWDSISGEQILNVMEKSNTLKDMIANLEAEPDSEHHHHHHHHGEEGEHEHHHHDHDEEEHEHHHHDHDEEEHEHHHHDHDEEEHEHHHHDHDEHGHHHHHHHGHDADEVFQSWGVETAHKFSKSDIKAVLETLKEGESYGIVLRAKGYVQDSESDKWIHFDLTPGEYEIREGSAESTGRLCVIGSGIKEDKLKELFNV
ncbi:MAG: GTP-binding protein [Lachnospiraceae bacterium]|nr:GTP-binding protein [Lachnospiraceae bacterium]